MGKVKVDANTWYKLLLLFEVSDLLNLLLIIATLVTVRYASQTLFMEYSSQIMISKYRRTIDKEKNTSTWEVDIENKGRGYVVKAFILLTVKTGNELFAKKEYHLSKPILDIDPAENDVITLTLTDKEFQGDGMKIEVYYQDALDHIYVVSPDANETHNHLVKFEKLPKKITFLSTRYIAYTYKFKKAIKQENTHVHREKQ